MGLKAVGAKCCSNPKPFPRLQREALGMGLESLGFRVQGLGFRV